MAYVKNIWVDQDVERPKTYEVTNNQDGSITLTDSFGLVTELGTPVNEVNMNHIEDGIDGCAIRKHNLTETFNLGEWVLGGTGDDEGIYKSLIANNVNNAITDDTKWEKVELGGGSSRNIGEIVTSTIPLTDAGLHLLDGALISGSGSYSAFVDYIADLYNTTAKTYKPSAFTVVGSPTITDDGIASGFSSSNYLTIPVDLSNETDYEIIFPVNWNSLTGSQNTAIFSGTSSTKGLGITIWSNTNMVSYGGNTGLTDVINGEATSNVKGKLIRFKYKNDVYSLSTSSDGSTWTESWTVTSSTKLSFGTTIRIGTSANFSNAWDLVEDLKQFSITVDGVEVFSGSDRTGFCLESEWQQYVTTYGVCGKFVYDSVNNTVRLPKYNSKIYTGGGNAPVKGNGLSLGLTNGTDNYTLASGSSYNTLFAGDSTNYGSNVGISSSIVSLPNVTYGVTTDGTKSGIVADLANTTTAMDCYYYIVVATTTKTSIQVDIDEIATDLNGKADVDLSNATPTISFATALNTAGIRTVVETYVNGTSWYRVYSDGWCEQGGRGNGADTINLLKSYKDTNYSVVVSNNSSNSYDIGITTMTTSSFGGSFISRVKCWEAKGYIA